MQQTKDAKEKTDKFIEICKNEEQKTVLEMMQKNDFTVINGVAGTGKSFCAMMAGIFIAQKEKLSILGIRPMREAGKEHGTFKGYYDEKIEPYIKPIKTAFIDADRILRKEIFTNKVHYLVNSDFDTPELMRGSTISNTIIVVDEYQNCSYDQIKMMATRIGENSKIVFCGDLTQRDVKDTGDFNKIKAFIKSTQVQKFVIELQEVVRGEGAKIVTKLFTDFENKNLT